MTDTPQVPLGYDDTNGTPAMTHPTDDELEAMAQRVELPDPPYVHVAAMLRACKGRDAPDHTQWNAALRTFRQVLSAQTRNTCNGLSEFEAGIACDVARSLEKDHPHD